MARAAYVVRDDSPGGPSGNVDKLYPYTLKGLVEALEEARFRSFSGPPQVVVAKGDDGMRVIRRFERGKEDGEAAGGALQAPCS
jgi:hypothetical protein